MSHEGADGRKRDLMKPPPFIKIESNHKNISVKVFFSLLNAVICVMNSVISMIDNNYRFLW